MSNKILFNQIVADDTSDNFESKGGVAEIIVRADDYGGGTITIQIASRNDPDERFDPLTNGVFTANASVKLDYLPVGILIRAVLADSSSAEAVFVEILQ